MKRPPSGEPQEPAWVSWAYEIGAYVVMALIVAAVAAGIVLVWP